MTTTARFDALVVAERKRLERALVALAIPHYMREGVINYVIEGVRPGGFLCAVFENNLEKAFIRADGVNRQRMGSWAELLVEHIPVGAKGSGKAIDRWVEIKGWRGLVTTEQQNDDDK